MLARRCQPKLDAISVTDANREPRFDVDWSISMPWITTMVAKMSSDKVVLADVNIIIVEMSMTRLNLDFRPFRLEWGQSRQFHTV